MWSDKLEEVCPICWFSGILCLCLRCLKVTVIIQNYRFLTKSVSPFNLMKYKISYSEITSKVAGGWRAKAADFHHIPDRGVSQISIYCRYELN